MMASKKKVSQKETRPTNKPEIKIPDSEARIKRDVSDLEISPYWTLEEFYCFLVGRLDWPWVALYPVSEDAWSDAGKIKFKERFSVAHNLGFRLLKAAQNGEIECAGTPPDPFPDSFENKYDKPSGRLWNPAALDLKLIRESCLRYYAGNKPAISFSLNEVGHGIPKINECLLDEWAGRLPQGTTNSTATTSKKNEYPKTKEALLFKSIYDEMLGDNEHPTFDGIRDHRRWPNGNCGRDKKTMKHWLCVLRRLTEIEAQRK